MMPMDPADAQIILRALFVINEVYADEYVKQHMTPLKVAQALADAGLLAPDLPEGWRLADHKVYGRVIVTTEKPDDDGLVAFVHRDDDLHRKHAHDWCKPDELTYLDTDQEPTDG